MEKLKKAWSWVAIDGLLHIETSALIMCVCPPCFGWWAALIASLFGIGKEVYDIFVKKSKPALSLHDLACDVIGIALGALVRVCYY